MKKYILVLLSLVFFIDDSSALEFKKPDTNKVLSYAVENHNNNLNFQELIKNSNANKRFLKDLKAYSAKSKVKSFNKADLIGNTVYFKSSKQMTSVQFIKMINSESYELKINGKNITININDGFAKNLELMKTAIAIKTSSVWELIVPRAYADDTTEDFEERLSDAVSLAAWFNSFFQEEIVSEKVKACALNEKEKAGYAPDVNSDTELFKEIKYLIEMQESYVRTIPHVDTNDLKTVKDYEMSRTADDFQVCILELAERRKVLIDNRNSHGFPCFKKYNSGRMYLTADLELMSYEETLEEKEKSLRNCIAKFNDQEKAECRKRYRQEIASLKLTCPVDAESAMALEQAIARQNPLAVQPGRGSKGNN